MSKLEWGPYAAHVLLIAAVYGLLLLVVRLSFRQPRASKQATTVATAVPADAALPLLADFEDSGTAGPAGEEADDLPPLPVDFPPVDLTAAAGPGTGQRAAGPGTGQRAAAAVSPLSRISAQLDFALQRPGPPPKPRELLAAARLRSQEPMVGNRRAMSGAKWAEQVSAADDDDMLEQEEEERRRELVLRERARKAEAAAIARGGGDAGGTIPGAAAAGRPLPPATYVAAAPLDAVYGAEPASTHPLGQLPLSPEERILAMHVNRMG
jgi:hypothetical protein